MKRQKSEQAVILKRFRGDEVNAERGEGREKSKTERDGVTATNQRERRT
jgi:hypothetical protein